MNHYSAYDELPRRGQPKKPVTYGAGHSLVLRAMFYLTRKGALITDQAIWDTLKQHNKQGDISPSGARTRRHELEMVFKLARLEPHVKGRTESGKKCSTYRLTDAGREKAQAEWEASRQLKLDTERSLAA